MCYFWKQTTGEKLQVRNGESCLTELVLLVLSIFPWMWYHLLGHGPPLSCHTKNKLALQAWQLLSWRRLLETPSPFKAGNLADLIMCRSCAVTTAADISSVQWPYCVEKTTFHNTHPHHSALTLFFLTTAYLFILQFFYCFFYL